MVSLAMTFRKTTPSTPKSKISKGDFEKAPLEIRGGVVTYRGTPLRTTAGPVR